jgi:predicted helicase
VLDLHGNAKKKERAPDGGKDENVFDIEQGVAISLFVKRKGLEKGVWRGDLWGSRLGKYKATSNCTTTAHVINKIHPPQPYYLFSVFDSTNKSNYDKYRSIINVFLSHSVGIVTGRDGICIGFTKEEMSNRISDFTSRCIEDARAHYRLGRDVQDWKV